MPKSYRKPHVTPTHGATGMRMSGSPPRPAPQRSVVCNWLLYAHLLQGDVPLELVRTRQCASLPWAAWSEENAPV